LGDVERVKIEPLGIPHREGEIGEIGRRHRRSELAQAQELRPRAHELRAPQHVGATLGEERSVRRAHRGVDVPSNGHPDL
jgi:hypothetical protein